MRSRSSTATTRSSGVGVADGDVDAVDAVDADDDDGFELDSENQ